MTWGNMIVYVIDPRASPRMSPTRFGIAKTELFNLTDLRGSRERCPSRNSSMSPSPQMPVRGGSIAYWRMSRILFAFS